MYINLIPDDSVSTAPTGFAAAVTTAAQNLDQIITNNITLNITYGWGSYDNQAQTGLNGTEIAEGGADNGAFQPYSVLQSWLDADPGYGFTALLPASTTSLPDGASTFYVSSAQEKSLGQYSGDPTAVDGSIGFGTGWTAPTNWVGAALHELTHAMGRVADYVGGDPTIFDLFRYSAPDTFQWVGGQPAYFSTDDGVTDLANFGTTSDFSDWADDGLTPNDPFDEVIYGNANALSPLDEQALAAIGFSVATEQGVIHLAPNTQYTDTDPNETIMLGGGTTGVSLQSSDSVLEGDAGVDCVTVAGSNNTVNAGSGATTVDAAASALITGSSGSLVLMAAAGAITMTGGTGPITVAGSASAAPLVFEGAAPLFFSGGNGAATVVGGSGTETIFANAGGGQFWGGSGPMLFVGGSGASTAIGGSGASTLFGGSGNDLLVAGSGPTTLVGAAGNTLLGTGSTANVLVAAGGSETLAGSGQGGSDQLFAGSGNDVLFGGTGSDMFIAGTGNADVVAESGSDVFVFSNGDAGGSDVIWGFQQGTDLVALYGYAPNALTQALHAASVSSSGTVLTLPDHTQITFAGITELSASDFVTP